MVWPVQASGNKADRQMDQVVIGIRPGCNRMKALPPMFCYQLKREATILVGAV
jgi:hypothetical protein